MDPEKLRQAWQSQPSGSQIRIDADVLMREVRRNQRSFRATVFWRDFREIFVAIIVLIAVSVDVGFRGIRGNWPWLLIGVGAAWAAGYLLFDRWRRRGSALHYDGTLISHIDQSLQDIEHQIWLLKNVFWWYLLPIALGGLIPTVFFFVRDLPRRPLHAMLWPFLLSIGVFVAVIYGAYLLNQSAVRRGLEPRRQELLAMRESLSNTEE